MKAVGESVAESPGISIWYNSQKLDISRSSLQHILMKDLHLHAYKVQELKHTDHMQQRVFVEWIMEQQVGVHYLNKIIFNNKTYFHLNDIVNRQNCHRQFRKSMSDY